MVKRFEERLYEDNCNGCMKEKHCHDECEYCCDKMKVLMDVAERVSERDVHICGDFTINELRTKSKSLADKVKAVYGW